MLSSIVSYPDRGPWGNAKWRGNTSGHLLRDWFLHIKPTGLVVDACKGSDTTGDVLRDLWRQKLIDPRCRYVGLDLYEGFNMFKDNLLAKLDGRRPQVVFAHPPYLDIVKYSRNEWGKVGKPNGVVDGDLSEVANPEEFQAKMASFMVNAYDALEYGGRTAILIGDVRRQGNYYCLASDLMQLGIGKLENVIVKAQHNCVSDGRQYSGSFIPIRHEWFLVLAETCKNGLRRLALAIALSGSLDAINPTAC